MRDRLQQELCQADFGRKRVTKLQSRLTFCHGRLFFSHFCCMDRKNVLHLHSERPEDGHTVDVAQLVRASDCGSEGRGFEPLLPPEEVSSKRGDLFFCVGTGMPARKPQRTLRPTPAPSHARSLHRPPQQEAADSHTARPPPVNNRISRPTPQSIQGPHAVSASSPPTDEPPPADRRASARRQTSLPPHRRSADSKAVRSAPLHFPLRHNRPIFRNRHYPHKHLNLRNRHRPRPSASKRHKKTAVPALGTAVVSMLEPA